MNKQQFEITFPNFARSTFRKIHDDFELTGLYVRVVPLEEEGLPDEWDVWICNARRTCGPASMTNGLSTRKLHNLMALAPAPSGMSFIELDGEAYFQSTDLGVVRSWLEENRIRLGIKVRKTGGGNLEALVRHRNAISTSENATI